MSNHIFHISSPLEESFFHCLTELNFQHIYKEVTNLNKSNIWINIKCIKSLVLAIKSSFFILNKHENKSVLTLVYVWEINFKEIPWVFILEPLGYWYWYFFTKWPHCQDITNTTWMQKYRCNCVKEDIVQMPSSLKS